MTNYLMLDDVNLTLLEKYAGPAHAVAGYVNGSYANYSELAAKYPTGKFLLSIDVANNPSAGAQCLDIESGDATIADAPGWFKTTQAAGKKANDLRYYPKLYTSESNLSALVSKMAQAGIARSAYKIWSAHYTGSAHICGPSSCGSSVQADATQWTDQYQGVSLDASLCSEEFFAGPPAPAKPAFPTPSGLSETPHLEVNFGWGAVPGAETYHFQIVQGSKSVLEQSLTTNHFSWTNPKPGTYSWRVAVDTSSSKLASPWSAEKSFTV